jgi:hypothetical protein
MVKYLWPRIRHHGSGRYGWREYDFTWRLEFIMAETECLLLMTPYLLSHHNGRLRSEPYEYVTEPVRAVIIRLPRRQRATLVGGPWQDPDRGPGSSLRQRERLRQLLHVSADRAHQARELAHAPAPEAQAPALAAAASMAPGAPALADAFWVP